MAEQIDLYIISARRFIVRNQHTAHLWPSWIFNLAVPITAVLPGYSVSIQPVLPFSDLPDFLIAVFVLVVTVRSRRVIDVVPVLRNSMFFAILLTFLSATSLSLLPATVEAINVIVVSGGCPVGQCTFGLWSCSIGGYGRVDGLIREICVRLGKCGLWLWLLA
jgi:hypothetical protein